MGKEVHCYSVPDYASAALAADVEDIFAQSAAARALGPRSRVLVKPNLVAKHAPEKGRHHPPRRAGRRVCGAAAAWR